MQYYMAPLEGVTDWIYRNAFQLYFEHADKYFIPFLIPAEGGKLSKMQKEEILPEHNYNMYAVPQILTNSIKEFTALAEHLKSYGYREINLNLGCPSRFVVSKGKGAGLLKDKRKLDVFLEEILAIPDIQLSVKTRLGLERPEEFYAILEVFNKHQLKEVIVHPRTQKEYYNGCIHTDVYREAKKESRNPFCYNGDIFSVGQYKKICEKIPGENRVMLGRGLIGNPFLIAELKGIEIPKKETWMRFQAELLQQYRKYYRKERYALSKIKELWTYCRITETIEKDFLKRIQRAETLQEYESLVQERGM